LERRESRHSNCVEATPPSPSHHPPWPRTGVAPRARDAPSVRTQAWEHLRIQEFSCARSKILSFSCFAFSRGHERDTKAAGGGFPISQSERSRSLNPLDFLRARQTHMRAMVGRAAAAAARSAANASARGASSQGTAATEIALRQSAAPSEPYTPCTLNPNP
jgi:hypothetical protein